MRTSRYQLLSIILFGAFLYYFAGFRNLLVYVTGLGFGFFFVYGSVGFTSAWRALIVKGNPYPFYGQAFMLTLGILIIMPLYTLFPTLNKVTAPLTYSSFIGAFLFGMGMQLGDGCGSGTLAKFSYNQFSKITIITFIIGAFLGTIPLKQLIDYGGLPVIDLVDTTSLPIAILIQCGLITLIVGIAWVWSKKKRGTNTFSWKDYKKLYLSFLGIVGLAILFLLFTGRGWGISFGLALWATKLAGWLGVNVTAIPYWQDELRYIALTQAVFFDPISLSNFGLILGAWYTATRKYTPSVSCANIKNILGASAGGLLMGFGSQLAFGCNIGPFFSGISSGSMHGWTWFMFAVMGTMVGIKLRKVFQYKE